MLFFCFVLIIFLLKFIFFKKNPFFGGSALAANEMLRRLTLAQFLRNHQQHANDSALDSSDSDSDGLPTDRCIIS